jgi:hypothetical protein
VGERDQRGDPSRKGQLIILFWDQLTSCGGLQFKHDQMDIWTQACDGSSDGSSLLRGDAIWQVSGEELGPMDDGSGRIGALRDRSKSAPGAFMRLSLSGQKKKTYFAVRLFLRLPQWAII